MFSTKQRVLILITNPVNRSGFALLNPTVRDIEHGLRKHFGIIRTSQHIRRLLRDLDHEGIIRRETRSRQPYLVYTQERPTRYEIVDFDRAFQDQLSLLGQAKVIVARERRQRKRKEL